MVIDKTEALERLAGNEALLDMLINKFIADNQNACATLNEFIKDDNPQDAAKLVHSIKGAAGNLSMHDLFASAKNLETLLKAGDSIEQAEIDNFESSLQAVLDL